MQTAWLPTSSSDSDMGRLVVGRFAYGKSHILMWKGTLVGNKVLGLQRNADGWQYYMVN